MAIAFVREPVGRFISHYRYCRQVAKEGLLFDKEAASLDLDEYILEVLYSNPKQDLWNGQCYHLFGDADSNCYSKRIASIDHERVMLLPVERFRDACLLLEGMFPKEFVNCAYKIENISKGSLDVSEKAQAEILNVMNFDRELYEVANRAFEEKLSKCFPEFSDLVAARAEFEKRCLGLDSGESNRVRNLTLKIRRIVGAFFDDD